MAETFGAAEAGDLSKKVDALKRDIADVAAMAKAKVVGGTTQWAKENPAAAGGGRFCPRYSGRAQSVLMVADLSARLA
jgi:hypothetical protein